MDNWGPPAGYARITGRVTSSAQTPIAGAEVLMTRCSSPTDGVLASAHTATDGTYHLTAFLPPIGLFPARADTVVVACDVIVNHREPPSASVEVRFAADSLAMRPQLLDLTVP